MRVWPLNAAAHYRQSLTLNKHTTHWLKGGGWLQYEETDAFFSPNKWFLETGMKQISSNRTKRRLSHFIWQLLSSVIAILNSPFIRFWGEGSILSTNGRSPLPSKTSTEDQMSRQEGEWWKDKQAGWGGGSVSSAWEKGAVVTQWPLTETFQVKLLLQREATQVCLWFGVRRSNTHIRTPALLCMLRCKYLAVGE